MEYDEARDIIIGMVIDNWDSSNPIEYQNKKLKPLPTADETWARVNIFHNPFALSSLADSSSMRRFNRSGNLIIQIFTPFNTGMGDSDTLTKIFVDLFEGKTDSSGQIWFRGAYIREIGNKDSHYQVNFICEFQYSQVK